MYVRCVEIVELEKPPEFFFGNQKETYSQLAPTCPRVLADQTEQLL